MVKYIKNSILIILLGISLCSGNTQEIPKFFTQNPREGLMEALIYFDVKHPEIVYAQAILETGWFTSDKCIYSNNLFGLYDSYHRAYYHFNHWVESVIAYKDFVQYKYIEGDYYKFLEDMGYAEDSLYIIKLQDIVKRYKEYYE